MNDKINKQYEELLSEYRKNIDNIDNSILKLLLERVEIIEKVRKLKIDNKETFFIKSAREADMIKTIISKAEKKIPKSLIIAIWRKIITFSNIIEQNLRIAIYNPNKINDYKYLTQEYYADYASITNYENINSIISEIEKNNAQIAIFALPKDDEETNSNNSWWTNLANNNIGLKVFAKIPFVKNSSLELVAMAIKKPEKSESDNSLFCIETSDQISSSYLLNALKESGLSAKILKVATIKQVENILFYLVEIEGFFTLDSEEIKKFLSSKISPFTNLLGHYPTQIIEDFDYLSKDFSKI